MHPQSDFQELLSFVTLIATSFRENGTLKLICEIINFAMNENISIVSCLKVVIHFMLLISFYTMLDI